tara:strand:- start:9919 stop:10773 length:855 start_codon:yes stop_codon:yes gene_type:complete
MMEASTDTAVQSENIEPVTDSANQVEAEQSAPVDTKSDNSTTPKVEQKDGKLFVDGVRVYTRDDTNKIAANAKHEVENRLVQELNVDSIDQVKAVVSTLQEVNPEEGNSLNVDSLRNAVKKREATVEELQNQVKSLKTDLLLKDHMSKLQSAMPSNWSGEQREAVVDLMKARNMLAVEGDTFAIRSGEDFLTTDGETPDYNSAVEVVGKSIGLPFGKKGVDVQYGETAGEGTTQSRALDEKRLISDPEYRSAYTKLRSINPSSSRSSFSDAQVKKMMDKMGINK